MISALNDGTFPSASLLIAKGGEIVMHKAYGNCTESSVFDIASLTKPIVTATLALHAVDKGVLRLEDTVNKFYEGIDDLKKITILNLLNHSSGFPAWQPFYRTVPNDHIGTKKGYDDVILFALNESLEYETGTKSIYSDIGFMILGDVLQIVLKKSLNELADELIFKPIGAESSFFRPVDKNVPFKKDISKLDIVPTEDCPWRKKVIKGFVHDQNCYAMGGVAGHAGLFSTTADIHLFIKGIMENFDEKKFFEMSATSPGTHLLGWDRPSEFASQSGTKFSKHTIGHLGFTGCSMWIDLEKKCWIILLSNRIHPTAMNQKIKSFRPSLHDTIMEEIA